jgi:glycosyltransferase involved in cell wall biosynthesis
VHILYLQPSGVFGGSPKSLIELFRCLAKSGAKATVLTPHGTAAGAFASSGMNLVLVKGLSKFDNTRFGYYRGLRWLIVLRELFFLPFSLKALWRLRREKIDIIHANDLTLLPLAILAKKLMRVPLILHVRSPQRYSDGSRRSGWVNRLLKRHADAVVAIDQTVAGTLGKDVATCIVRNGFDSFNSEPRSPEVGDTAIKTIKVGFVGVLLPLKGIYELVHAMRILRDCKLAIELVVVGENSRALTGAQAWVLRKLGFYRDVRSELEVLVEEYGLRDCVKFLGSISDVREFYPTIDILCFPSHLDAAGRPVFEAAFYGVPSVVAVVNPKPDAIMHNVTGLAIQRPDPVLIADALQRLAKDKEFRLRLGRQAQEWARENFSIVNSAEQMHEIYRCVMLKASKNVME